MWVRSTSVVISSVILDAASSFTITMRTSFYIVLLGALVLANVSGEVDSTRESLERSTFDDQTDDNEKVIHAQSLATIESFLRSPVNVSKDTQTGRIKLPPIDSGGPQVISDANERTKDSKHSEEALDLSSEGNPPQLKTHVAASLNQSVTVDPAAQVVNASTEDIKTRMAINAQGQRTIATNKLLQNRLDRSRTTTTANPISGHSDEESDDSDKKTTTARSLPTKNRFGGLRTTTARSSKESSERDDSVKRIQTTLKPIQSTTTGKFGRFRTVSVPVSNNSDEEIGLTKPIVTTTVRSFTLGNRFNRVRTTTVSTPDVSAEEIESVSEVKTTTAAGLTFGNRFGRFRTTTPVSKNSDEEVDTVKEITTTTVRPSLPNNRFNRFKTTAVPMPVTQESKGQSNVTTSTSIPLKLLIGNKFNRIRTTTVAVPISDTSDEIAESVNVTQTTTSRTLTSTSRLSRFRTTAAPASKKDSEEQDDVVNVTTTTLRPSPFRNLFGQTRTTTNSPISRDSIEEEDVANKTSTTTVRSLPTRKMFGLPRTITVPAQISTSSDEDVVNKTETTTTRRFLAGNRFGRIRTTTLSSTTSKNSDEEVDDVISTTTARSLATANRFKGFRVTTPASRDWEEQVHLVNNTQTNARNSLLRNRFSRLQTTTTTTSIPIVDISDEEIDSGNGTQTTSASIQIEMPVAIDSDEQDGMNNSTETTTFRNPVALKYSHRYRTTTVRNSTLENSEEQTDELDTTTLMTSSIQIPSTTKSRPTPLTPASKLAALPSEIANLERKDRAIIYNAKSNVVVNHPDKYETTTSLPIVKNYYTTQHSDELDDVSEDEDISSILYTYIEFRTTAVPTTRVVNEDNSAEDFSLETKDSMTEKPEHSAEIADDDRVTIVGPEDVSMDKKNDDVSLEFIIVVTNNSESTRNKTAAAFFQGAKLLMDSDEGNDVSAEGEGSGGVPNDDDQYQTTPVQQDVRVVSEEGTDASAETELSRDITNQTSSVEQSPVESEERSNVSTDTEVSDSKHDEKIENQTESVEQDVNLVTESDEGKTTSAEGEVLYKSSLSDNREDRNKTSAELPQESDEKDESSLEVDVSKLPEIKRLLTDVEESSTEAEDKPAAVRNENRVLFPEIEQLFKLEVENQTAAQKKSMNKTQIEEDNKKKEVNMKIRELLTNPIVQGRLQERLQAIDGRLKDSKSARVKRLIEKYLAALAKLSPPSNSATSFSFSVLLPFMVTCFLLGFS